MRSWIGTFLMVGMCVAGCEKDPGGDVGKKEGGEVAREVAEEKAFGTPILSVGNDLSAKPATRKSVVGGVLTIRGQAVAFGPSKIILSKDGTAVWTVDGGEQGNSISLQMIPVTDGEHPWKRAVWVYRKTGAEGESADGIYIGGAEHQLKPEEVRVEIERSDEGEGRVKVEGVFEADVGMGAGGGDSGKFEVKGEVGAAIEGG